MNAPSIASRRVAIGLITAAAVVVSLAAGCTRTGPSVVAPVQKQVVDLRAEVAQLQQRIANQQETIENQRKQIVTLQQMGPSRPARLAPLEGIKFAGLSGTYDDNNDSVPEGVVVYVQPYDADGDSIKVAGELSVRIFDLTNPKGPELIRQYTWNAEQLRKTWNDRFMTGHFTARCPWPDKYQPPRQVTVQAQFVDSLTGKAFSHQAVLAVKSTEPAK